METGYPRNAWYVAAWSKDLDQASGKPLPVEVMGEPIALWRSNGELVAFEDRCVHRAAPLSLGRCEGGNLRCMYHGFLYSSAGSVVEIPGQDSVPDHARVKTYPVASRSGWIWLWMGDTEAADLDLIPDVFDLDDPDYLLVPGQLDYEAEASLILDNLLDFSHLTYVHSESFGSGPEFAHSHPRWETLPRGLRYSKWTTGTRSPPGQAGQNSAVDVLLTYDFLVPGVLVLWTGLFEAGTADRLEYAQPDRSAAIGGGSGSSQAVTPLSRGRSRYFFSAGPHRSCGDEQERERQAAVAMQAFLEDKAMIEAQQKIIESTRPDVMPSSHDWAITYFHGLQHKLSGG